MKNVLQIVWTKLHIWNEGEKSRINKWVAWKWRKLLLDDEFYIIFKLMYSLSFKSYWYCDYNYEQFGNIRCANDIKPSPAYFSHNIIKVIVLSQHSMKNGTYKESRQSMNNVKSWESAWDQDLKAAPLPLPLTMLHIKINIWILINSNVVRSRSVTVLQIQYPQHCYKSRSTTMSSLVSHIPVFSAEEDYSLIQWRSYTDPYCSRCWVHTGWN